MVDSIRIDKWLWAVRIYKTRSQAGEACKGGKVKIDGQNAKASREVKVGDVIEIQQKGILRKVQIFKAVKNRVAAKLVPELMKDLTSAKEYEKLEMLNQLNQEKRDRGIGRPTKKDRRTISKLKDF
ncbi:MAG: RNA-binding S4 domain-containing protein [Bacteroidetes bacterium]|nr:RNA-binding S4 domain-containing protein [Bacteroidota bacterium]